MTKIKSIIATILLLFAVSNVFSEELIIRIEGEPYSREMPTDIFEARELIRNLVGMVNNSDDEIIALNEQVKTERTEYIEKLNSISAKLDEANNKLAKTEKQLEVANKDVSNELKTDTRCTPFIILGPAINFNKTIGLDIAIGFDYRVLRNFHIGATLSSTIFADDKLDGSLGLGFVLGYSIY